MRLRRDEALLSFDNLQRRAKTIQRCKTPLKFEDYTPLEKTRTQIARTL